MRIFLGILFGVIIGYFLSVLVAWGHYTVAHAMAPRGMMAPDMMLSQLLLSAQSSYSHTGNAGLGALIGAMIGVSHNIVEAIQNIEIIVAPRESD
jgi:hypothetical protein